MMPKAVGREIACKLAREGEVCKAEGGASKHLTQNSFHKRP